MYQYHCVNKISKVGTDCFTKDYEEKETMEKADALLVGSAELKETEFPDSVKAIARAGAGVSNIPLERCAEEGIVVFNTPGANANGVKELVIAGMLLASRDIVGGIGWVKDNKENADIAKQVEKVKSAYAGKEIKGKKLGIIGLGAIGVEVANAAMALGMEVFGFDPYISVDHAWKLTGAVKAVKTKEELYRECDYITLRVPLFDNTRGIIDKAAIEQMKDGVVVLNFARDLLVNENDMVAALESGKVAHYVTDFPNPTTAGKKGTICIPHLGASTEESEDNCAVMAVKQLMDYLENGNIMNSVNYPNVDAGICQAPARVGILHKNVPNMLAQFTSVFSADEINIENLINRSRGEFAYTVLDVSSVNEVLVTQLSAIPEVRRVRIIKG